MNAYFIILVYRNCDDCQQDGWRELPCIQDRTKLCISETRVTFSKMEKGAVGIFISYIVSLFIYFKVSVCFTTCLQIIWRLSAGLVKLSECLLFTETLMTVSRMAGENCRAFRIALNCAYQKLRQLSATWRKYQSGCSYLVSLFLSECLLYYLFTENLVIVSRRAGETCQSG